METIAQRKERQAREDLERRSIKGNIQQMIRDVPLFLQYKDAKEEWGAEVSSMLKAPRQKTRHNPERDWKRQCREQGLSPRQTRKLKKAVSLAMGKGKYHE